MLTAYRRDGYVVLRDCIADAAVAQLVEQVEAELDSAASAEARPQSERNVGPLSLNAPGTWPTGGRRRVVETAPVGTVGEKLAPHWEAILTCSPLAVALDSILGKENWYIPVNVDPHGTRKDMLESEGLGTPGVRHWYVPVSFPENIRSSKTGGQPSAKRHRVDEPNSVRPAPHEAGNTLRPVRLATWKDDLELPWTGDEAADARSFWQPVSRRRIRGKGWHLDLGPGFDGSQKRSLGGHCFQGVVMLILLSDCDLGAGGTVMWPGSHHIVRRELARHPAGIVHDELNAWAVDSTLAMIREGKMMLSDSTEPPPANMADEPQAERDGAPAVLQQVTGKAGDVILMHPWLIHAGTTNFSSKVRVMANGMVRVRDPSKCEF
mmetsp:Transcript_70251/g.187094  ORF Transcript_70251/g.187094 Transcript_70251/m.187094 type:complete len:379 (-) Transcript_70251:110-1246(-)